MQPSAMDDAREWLVRAVRDLLLAERAIQGAPPLAEASVFHAQQAAEKALKGYLAAHNQKFARTHDLVELVTRCEVIDSEFFRFLEPARLLTPYAVRFRYPGGPLEPEAGEAEQAIDDAHMILAFVHVRLGLAGPT